MYNIWDLQIDTYLKVLEKSSDVDTYLKVLRKILILSYNESNLIALITFIFHL